MCPRASTLCVNVVFCTRLPTTEIYTLSLHDALPISRSFQYGRTNRYRPHPCCPQSLRSRAKERSEEHTSELQSLRHLVCRLLPEKKNGTRNRWFAIFPTSKGLYRPASRFMVRSHA